MTSFRSKKYPASTNKVRITQESAMQYYAAFNVMIMLYVVAAISTGDFSLDLLWQVLIAEGLAVWLGNLLGTATMPKSFL